MKQFSFRLSLFSLLIGGMLVAWNGLTPEKLHTANAWISFIVLLTTTFSMHWFLVGAGDKQPAHFVRAFIGFTTLKLFFYLLVIIAYCLISKPTGLNFAAGFLAQYFFFTAFEVFELLKHFNKFSK